MSFKGYVDLEDTLYFLFTTRRFSTGATYTLGGTPALSVYEENNATQITSGVSLTADYDTVTGLNQAAVVASAANGYEVGKHYDVVITTGTVDSVSVVGEVVGHFIVGPASANVVQWLGTAAATPTTAGVPEVDVTHWLGTAAATPTVAGVPEVDVTHWIGTAAATPTVAGVPEVDITHFGGAAGTFASGKPDVNVTAVDGGDWPTTVAALVDSIWDEALSGHVTAGTVGQRLAIVRANTAAGGGATSITLDGSASATNDIYNGHLIHITGGTGAGQCRYIRDYDGGTKVCTVGAWITQPDNTSVFVITPFDAIQVQSVTGSVGSIATGGIAAASFAAGAIDAAAIATGAIDADAIADNAIDAGALAADCITAAKIADNAIDAGALAADCITAAKIADGAIDAGAIAADAITAAKIADGAIDAATFAADVDAEVLSYLVDDATRIDASALNTATATTIPAIAADNPNRITKNTALAGFTFLMIDSSDHITPKTGLTITATRSLDGAAFAACTNSATEVSNGIYTIDLAAGDLNGNVVTLRFTAANADDRFITLVTQPT